MWSPLKKTQRSTARLRLMRCSSLESVGILQLGIASWDGTYFCIFSFDFARAEAIATGCAYFLFWFGHVICICLVRLAASRYDQWKKDQVDPLLEEIKALKKTQRDTCLKCIYTPKPSPRAVFLTLCHVDLVWKAVEMPVYIYIYIYTAACCGICANLYLLYIYIYTTL